MHRLSTDVHEHWRPGTCPRRRCAEPSHASALADTGRLNSVMATMWPHRNSAAATVSNYPALSRMNLSMPSPQLGRGGLTKFSKHPDSTKGAPRCPSCRADCRWRPVRCRFRIQRSPLHGGNPASRNKLAASLAPWRVVGRKPRAQNSHDL
jgi:hypothetical protein